MSSPVIAIHQPNFFPWLGYFQKLLRADQFVFLDHVRINPNQSYLRRVQVFSQGKNPWLTLNVQNPTEENDFPKINTLTIPHNPKGAAKQLRMLKQTYAKAPYLKDFFVLIEEFYNSSEPNLAKRNSAFILKICELLQINTPCVMSSELDCQGESTALLVDLCKTLDGKSYLCGGGASNYQEDTLFDRAGIEVIYQKFTPPVYSQLPGKPFVPGLSVIDALLFCGPEKVRELLASEQLVTPYDNH